VTVAEALRNGVLRGGDPVVVLKEDDRGPSGLRGNRQGGRPRIVGPADDPGAAGPESEGTQSTKGLPMIRKGDTIDNPVTGERLLFLETSAETGGEYTLVECTVQPNGFVASAHVHPKQTERFEIEAGLLEFTLDGERIVAGPGETVVVPAGSAHKFRNVGETAARFVCEVRPSLGFERLLETMFALANDGKVNRRGLPNPLRLAVIANAHFEDVNLPFPPAWLQKAGLVMGAPVGKLLGFGATYDGAGSEDAALAI
jgi:quercetin dioxygenase-like cupin family protein